MLTAAGHGDGQTSNGSLVAIGLFCLLLLANGVRHYRGYGKRWITLFWFGERTFFSSAYLGAAGLALVVDLLVLRASQIAGAILGVPTLALFAVALVSFWWLPDRMLPEWYLSWRAHGRPPGELLR